jgi:hypothetical protein
MFTINFKKMFLAAAVFAAATVSSFAQTKKGDAVSMVQGDELVQVKGGLKEQAKSYLGKDANGNMLFYCIQKKSLGKTTDYLVAYDAKMHVVKRTEIKNEIKKPDEPYFFRLKNKIYFMPLFPEGNLKINCYEFDIKTATVLTTPVAQTTFSFPKVRQDYQINTKIFFSPDSNFVAIQARYLGVVHFKVFDANMHEVASVNATYGKYYDYTQIVDPIMDNQGNIYGIKSTEIDKKDRKTRMITNSFLKAYDYTCIKIDKTGKVTEQILNVEKKYLHSAKLAISEDVLVVGGLYSENTAESIGAAGFALLLLDSDMKTIRTTFKPVSYDILKKGKNGKNIIDGNWLTDVCITKNHIYLVNLSPVFSGDYYTTMVIAGFTDIGDTEWVKVMEETTAPYWIKTVEEGLIIINEDDRKRRVAGKGGVTFSSDIIVLTTINVKGEIVEQILPFASNSVEGVTLLPLDGNKATLFTLNANLVTIK